MVLLLLVKRVQPKSVDALNPLYCSFYQRQASDYFHFTKTIKLLQSTGIYGTIIATKKTLKGKIKSFFIFISLIFCLTI